MDRIGLALMLVTACKQPDKTHEALLELRDRLCSCLDDGCAKAVQHEFDEALRKLDHPPGDQAAIQERMMECAVRRQSPAGKEESRCKNLAGTIEQLVDNPQAAGNNHRERTPAEADAQRRQIEGDCRAQQWSEATSKCVFFATTLDELSACGITIR